MSETRVLPPMPDQPSEHQHQPAPVTPDPRPRRRTGAVTALLVGCLALGGAAGVGGAAAWETWQDDTGAATPDAEVSQVIDTGDSPAPDGSVEQVASAVLPSVVKIDVAGPEGSGSGSGIILSSDGRILTNNHVVEVAADGGTLTVLFNDGTTAQAEVLGTDALTDTAVIQAQDVSGLTPATIGSSDELKVGQGVVAVGSPFGLESTVTSGIVSALNRPVNVADDGQGNSTTYPAIQTDAAINPGNSGGPLVDLSGNVVGINSSIRTASTGSDGSIGLGFSIPIDGVLPIVEQMAGGEEPTHAKLGVSVSDVRTASGEVAQQGAQIGEITPGSTADQAGLEAGDIVTKVDDTRITGADSLVATIRSYRPGDTVTLTWMRDGEEQTAELVLDSD
jgi:putative serine protease PepD